ncbi:MAG TPA: hypothetical protein VGD67_02225 [Pseudonocardiaceae bacterium]
MQDGSPGVAGGFEVTDARYELPTAIGSVRQGLADLERFVPVVMEQALLGTSFGAEVITEHNRRVAQDLDGLVPQLENFRVTLDEALQALRAADRTYQGAEQDNTGELSGHG